MTAQTVPDQQVTNEELSRDEVYTSLLHGLIANLPTPRAISFRSTGVNFTFDSRTDLMAWGAWFGMQDRDVDGQPYPSLSDPADMDRWSSRVWAKWRGWHLGLNSMDAITDEQRDGWVSSGQAASFAEHEAKQAADATGLTYSREVEPADDPTPVSPARGGAPHVVAVTNGGLVDETPDEAECSCASTEASFMNCEVHGEPAATGRAYETRKPIDQDAEDAAAFDRGFMAEHRRAAEAATLSAAIRFSEARREAFRLMGRTTSKRLLAATLDLLHGQALDEDADRARRADVREGEQGRITNPDLAHFLAKKEEARREARHFLGLEESAKHGQPAEVLHMQFASGDTSCGLTQGEYRDGCGTANQAAVTCKACIDGMPF